MVGSVCSEGSTLHSGMASCMVALKSIVIKDELTIESGNTQNQAVQSLGTGLQ